MVILKKSAKQSNKSRRVIIGKYSNYYVSKFPHGLMFHHFHNADCKPAGQGSLTVEQFELILNFVGIDNILNPVEWLRKVERRKLAQQDVCITFDDGLKCQLDVCLSVLEKYDLQAFWFIYSAPFEKLPVPIELYRRFRCEFFDNVDEYYVAFFEQYTAQLGKRIESEEFQNYYSHYKDTFPFYSDNDIRYRYLRDCVLAPYHYQNIVEDLIRQRGSTLKYLAENLWLDNDDLRNLCKNGHIIGLHSFDHPTKLENLPPKLQRDQYLFNKQHLDSICEKTCVMSHPCNSYNDDTIKILDDLGISCGFRSNMLPPRGKSINPSRYEFAREDASNLLQFYQRLSLQRL